MYQFPNKVNQRRRIRQLKRQSVHQIIDSNNDFADINYSNESISSYSSNNNDLIVVSGRSPSNALSNTDVCKRISIDSFSSPKKNKKRSKIIQDDGSSSFTQSDEGEVSC
ncbi:unnamed protein product [Rotaria magnacalcarata]|uniref:Uncharacterized protein n=1 Tax=Rotaria magnacalcarata TaxID=392030 RepID=A0A816MF57_9BILA|nr:unnamed protein product [Rotaria magnacalcarata]